MSDLRRQAESVSRALDRAIREENARALREPDPEPRPMMDADERIAYERLVRAALAQPNAFDFLNL